MGEWGDGNEDVDRACALRYLAITRTLRDIL